MRAHPAGLTTPGRSAPGGLAAPAPLHRPPGMARRLGALAAHALAAELATWPKPGLVSHVDSGSHDDMDWRTFERSIAALEPYFVRLAAAGAEAAAMAELRRIGCKAEAAMLAATGGANTHRGAIFALGLLCAGAGLAHAMQAGRAQGGRPPLRPGLVAALVRRCWGAEILSGPIPLGSHGTAALLRFGAGGARLEAAAGFPSVRRIGLPALRAARAAGAGEAAARVQAFFALLAGVEDTNLLHRGGADGLQAARQAARHFLDEGGTARGGWLERAVGIHRGFVALRLSPGGSADLLAASILLDRLERGA